MVEPKEVVEETPEETPVETPQTAFIAEVRNKIALYEKEAEWKDGAELEAVKKEIEGLKRYL